MNCNENNIEEIDLLKMDIEGAEYDALQSLNTDFFKKVKYMLIETHENTIENQKCKNLVQFLRQNDFIINEFNIKESNLPWLNSTHKDREEDWANFFVYLRLAIARILDQGLTHKRKEKILNRNVLC